MPSLSEAFRAHPVHFNHNKHPDFNTLQELPDSYAWTQLDDHDHTSNNCHNIGGDQLKVPVIDLNDPNAPNFIGNACKTWGVFQVVNHGIPMSLLSDIQCVGQNLFSLPLHHKLRAARSPDGVSGYGRARISSFFPKLMWSECFTIVDESPLEHFLQLWPHDYGKYWYVSHTTKVLNCGRNIKVFKVSETSSCLQLLPHLSAIPIAIFYSIKFFRQIRLIRL